MTVRMIIDTDTAQDDAFALLIGLRHPAAQLEAVTIKNVKFRYHELDTVADRRRILEKGMMKLGSATGPIMEAKWGFREVSQRCHTPPQRCHTQLQRCHTEVSPRSYHGCQ